MIDLAVELAAYGGQPSVDAKCRAAQADPEYPPGWENPPMSGHARAKMERRRAKHVSDGDGVCSYCGEPWPCPKLARLPDAE